MDINGTIVIYVNLYFDQSSFKAIQVLFSFTSD